MNRFKQPRAICLAEMFRPPCEASLSLELVDRINSGVELPVRALVDLNIAVPVRSSINPSSIL